MNLVMERAQLKDVEELLQLYFSIYGNSYPLKLGIDRKAMSAAISDPHHYFWPVMRDKDKGVIAGTVIFELDHQNKIGKISGLAVHPDYRQNGISRELVVSGKKLILDDWGVVNSLYATTRTIALAPQLVFLKNGFIPLGLFPNAHKLHQYETLTLFGAFKEGVLSKRESIANPPASVVPIMKVIGEVLQDGRVYAEPGEDSHKGEEFRETVSFQEGDEEAYEFIFAPHFVAKRFKDLARNDEEFGYYPFHTPNLLITSSRNSNEIYASFNKKDHYCVIIGTSKSPQDMDWDFKNLFYYMKDHGISYVEALVRPDQTEAIKFFWKNDFVPSAVYPAMREIGGKHHDYIIFTRTMEPLDFKGIKMNKAFSPFVDQYIQQWFNMHIKSLVVDNG